MVSAPNPTDPRKLAADVASLAGDSSGGSSLYGASGDVLNGTFDPSGLTGLANLFGNGMGNQQSATGQDILRAFLAAGQSDDPTVRNTVAAIEYALFQANYYTSGAPNLHEVTGDDVKALGQALTDLHNAGLAGASKDGTIKPMSVAQFLTSQATLAASGGPMSPATAARKTKVVRTPNPADVAAEYEKIAANLEGKRPSQSETQSFVRQYMQNYTSEVLGQTASSYQQQVGQARQKQLSGTTATPPVGATPAAPNPNLPHGITAVDPNTGMSPEVPNPGVGDFPSAMATLNDVLGSDSSGGVEFAASPESIDTAAENFARNANPTATRQNDLGNTLNTFLNLITTKLV